MSRRLQSAHKGRSWAPCRRMECRDLNRIPPRLGFKAQSIGHVAAAYAAAQQAQNIQFT
jgi:hypothetical protein